MLPADAAARSCRERGLHVVTGIADERNLAQLGMMDVIVMLDADRRSGYFVRCRFRRLACAQPISSFRFALVSMSEGADAQQRGKNAP